jgi:small basic protein (TIGR04137 family)
MGLHPSLKQGQNKGFLRSVLNRIERIKLLMEKGSWTEENKVFGLSKTKIVRMKAVKKEKKAETPETTTEASQETQPPAK